MQNESNLVIELVFNYLNKYIKYLHNGPIKRLIWSMRRNTLETKQKVLLFENEMLFSSVES